VVAAGGTVVIGHAKIEQGKDAGSVRIEADTGATQQAALRRFAAGRAGRISDRGR
jgi:hypothetical protein